MNILVTGGCGYIGSELIRTLPIEYSSDTIRIMDNMFREKYVSLWNLPTGIKYEFIEGDITKNDDVKKAMEDIDIVFDLAGITNAQLSFERKKLTFNTNHNGVKNLIKYADNVKRYIYSSTASVYGPTSGLVNEDFECKPVSPYGESKLLAEKELMKAHIENGLNVVMPRLGTVYGWSIGMRFDTVIDRFAYLACLNRPLEVYESAVNEKRPYIHVSDAVNAMMFLMKENCGGIFNVVNENAGIGFITDIIKQLIPETKVIITNTPSLNQLSYELDGSKMMKLGYHTECNMGEGIREIIEMFKGIR